jgi:hypothetical protein
MRIQAIALFILLALVTGCVGTFDRLTPIEGELASSDGRPLNGCSLQAIDATTGQPVPGTRAEVTGRFRTGFANPPRSGRYFIAIDCGPRRLPFKSPEMDFSIVKPIDLGRIEMGAK